MIRNSKSEKFITYGALGILVLNALMNFYDRFRKQTSPLPSKTQEEVISTPNLSKKSQTESQSFLQPKRPLKRRLSYFHKPSHVFKIVLTGGPCSGKTTAVAHISDRLRERGIKVYCVPEAATLIAGGGGFINAFKLDSEGQMRLQSVISQLTLDIEDHFCQLASNEESMAVVLCDRGIMDGKAYCNKEVWDVLLEENGWNIIDIRDKRYDAVLHMVTTAEGCKDLYSNLTNHVRFETAEQAIEIDKKLREAWSGHSNIKIVDNKQDFKEKLNKAFNFVLSIIGLSGNVPITYKKYLLKKVNNSYVPSFPSDFKVEKFEIEDTYLSSQEPNTQIYLRRKTLGGNSFYIHNIRKFQKCLSAQEKMIPSESKSQITARDYMMYLSSTDDTRKTLKKSCYTFVCEGAYLFILSLDNVKEPFSLIYLDASLNLDEVPLPEFIKIDKDVTDDEKYSSWFLSKKDK